MYCKRFLALIFGLLVFGLLFPQDDLKIESWTVPSTLGQGEEGVLKIKIMPRQGIRVSSHPEFMIRFSESEQFSFSKIFFTASELNFSRIQEGEGIFLDLQKEIEIPFRVSAEAFIGKHTIRGEIVFTIRSADNWYIKTVQKFSTVFNTRKSAPSGKKGSAIKKRGGLPLADSSRAIPRYDNSRWFRLKPAPVRFAE